MEIQRERNDSWNIYKQVEKQYGNERYEIGIGQRWWQKQQAYVIERRTNCSNSSSSRRRDNNNKNGKLVYNAKIIEKPCSPIQMKCQTNTAMRQSNTVQHPKTDSNSIHCNPIGMSRRSSLNDDESDNVVQNGMVVLHKIDWNSTEVASFLDISTSADWKECQSEVHLVFSMISLTQFTIEKQFAIILSVCVCVC